MKYINTALPLFNTITNQQFTTGCIESSGNTTGNSVVYFVSDKDIIYLKCKILIASLTSATTGHILELYLSNGNYIDLHFNGTSEYLSVEINDSRVSASTYSHSITTWRDVAFTINLKEGTIDFYLDSILKETITGLSKIKGASTTQLKVITRKTSSTRYSAVKNIILSDEPIPANETLVEIPVNVVSATMTANSDGTYTADSVGQNITVKPDLTNLDAGYRIANATLLMANTQTSETINNVKMTIGDYEETIALSNTGSSAFSKEIDNPDFSNNITIEAV